MILSRYLKILLSYWSVVLCTLSVGVVYMPISVPDSSVRVPSVRAVVPSRVDVVPLPLSPASFRLDCDGSRYEFKRLQVVKDVCSLGYALNDWADQREGGLMAYSERYGRDYVQVSRGGSGWIPKNNLVLVGDYAVPYYVSFAAPHVGLCDLLKALYGRCRAIDYFPARWLMSQMAEPSYWIGVL